MGSPAPSPAARVSGLRPTAVNRILQEVRQYREGGRTPLSLMRGEPDFATPTHIVEAAARSLRDGRTHYPDNRGEIELREAVAEKLARGNALSYDPASEILITTGATFGLHIALTAVLSDGAEVLLPGPIYDAYESVIRLAGGLPRSVPGVVRGGRFALDTDAMQRACTPATRVLLLNTPWNPTGTVFSADELAAIGEIVDRHHLVLISDEIYEAITYDGCRHVSPASLSDEARRRTIVINSFSKTYAMTGWRLGYCAAPPDVTQAMFLVLQQSSRGPAPFIQDAGVAALRSSQECVSEMRNEYARRRQVVRDRLAGMPGVSVLSPEGGFFCLLDARELGMPSEQIRRRLLSEYGVVVVHGSAYGEGGEGTLRVSFSSAAGLEPALDRLREGLLNLRAEPAART